MCHGGLLGKLSRCSTSQKEPLAVVRLLSCVWLFVTPWTTAHQVCLSLTISWTLPKFMSIELVMLSNCLILCHTLLFLPSIFPNIRVSSNESALCIRWPKYWSFSISPSNEYSRLMSFQIDWFELFAVQGTLKTLLQNHQPPLCCKSKTLARRHGVFLVLNLSIHDQVLMETFTTPQTREARTHFA